MIDIVALITAVAPIISTVAGLILSLFTYINTNKIHTAVTKNDPGSSVGANKTQS